VKNSDALKDIPVVGKVLGKLSDLAGSTVGQSKTMCELWDYCKDHIDQLPDCAKCIVDGCAMAHGVSMNYLGLQQGAEDVLKASRSHVQEGLLHQMGPMRTHAQSLHNLNIAECNSEFLDGLRRVSKGLREGVVRTKNLMPMWVEEEKLENPVLDVPKRREEIRRQAIH